MLRSVSKIFVVIIGFSILSLLIISCDKESTSQRPLEASNDYNWTAETFFSHVRPIYADESYFIFPMDHENRDMYLLRLNEKTGDTIFCTQLLKYENGPSISVTKAYLEEEEIHLLLDKSFYKIDIYTGEIKTQYNFPRYLSRSNIEEKNIYTCSFYPDFQSMYYSYFDKDIGEQNIVYSAYNDTDQNSIIGHAPMESGNSLIFPLSQGVSGNFDNVLVKVSDDSVFQEKVDFDTDIIGGPVFDDDDTVYMYMIDKLVAYNKSDLSVKWELNTVSSGAGPYYQTEDKIYLVPSREIQLGDANIIYIINKVNGGYKVVDSPACLTYIERVGDFLYFIGWGEFKEFNMMTEEFEPQKIDEKSREAGYQSYFGVSPNSKIVWDHYGWHCFPL